MFYEAELNFLRAVFRKCHLQTLLIDPFAPVDSHIDMGLAKLFGTDEDHKKTFTEYVGAVSPNTIYKLKDIFKCGYLFMLLPDTDKDSILIIGPYRSEEMQEESMYEFAEKFGLPPRQMRQLAQYYNGIPVILESSHLFSVLDSFGEHIWGGAGNFIVNDVDQEQIGVFSPLITARREIADPDQTIWDMQIMETRYEYENELMEAVSHGQLHKAELLLASFASTPFEQRLSDSLRNSKNYCIIMNTLLRKSAEKGGVHPVYIDRVSSSFARKIEQLESNDLVYKLMLEMFRSYCRLVRHHSMRAYSAPVQKAIAYIDSDLSADLSLHSLAAAQSVSASYLSSLFKRETGQTLTDYVNQHRINLAMQLLKNTKLQIQTVAQHCGILDVHYFSKLFKRYTQKTPKEYRQSLDA